MELEEKLIEATSKTFSKFTELLAKVDPVAALLFTGAAITPVIGSAFVVEMLHQQEILRSGGVEAFKAYNALSANGAVDFVAKGVAGVLPSEAQNTLGKSMLAMVVLPLTACVSTFAAGRFQSLKDEIRTLEQGGRNIDPSRISRVTYPVRDTCATKLSGPERFDQSWEALSRKIEMIQSAEAVQQRTGPKP
jgi:hypothetical protein